MGKSSNKSKKGVRVVDEDFTVKGEGKWGVPCTCMSTSRDNRAISMSRDPKKNGDYNRGVYVRRQGE